MSERCIALLGRRDEPTDGVEEYCRYLGEALRAHGFDLQLVRVDFARQGWRAALKALRRQAAAWQNSWVLVQYTALAWSKRGFPLQFPAILKTLRDTGAHVAVVFHDIAPHSAVRMIGRFRAATQERAMENARRQAHLSIFTIALDKVSWLPANAPKAVFIPVGANLPLSVEASAPPDAPRAKTPTVAVFGITGGETGRRESEVIAETLRFASKRIGQLRLTAFGRHADGAEPFLREFLRGADIELEVSGVLPGEEVVRKLRAADVSLFVRGPISSGRGSAIAGIACGLPVIAYDGPETAFPVTEAGVLPIPPGKPAELVEALVRVLSDREYRAALAERSRRAQEQFFSWTAIARQYVNALKAS